MIARRDIGKTLQPPTGEEKAKPVYQNSEIKIFPYALTAYVISCPQYAVFRIESSNGNWAYMAISSNEFVCPFSSDWQEVFDDFLVFARAAKLTPNNLALADFFKQAPGRYSRGPMEAGLDLLEFMKEATTS